ncbi:MAG: glycosyltransferase [Sedimenticolaceae bacterium]
MRILMLSDVFAPPGERGLDLIQTFAGAFLASGHTLTLIAPDYPMPYESAFEVIRIPARTLPLVPEDRLMSLSAIKRLVPELQTKAFDIVHIQTPFVAHYAGLFLGKALGLKTVVDYHTYFEAYFEKYLPWLPNPLLRAIARSYSRKQCNKVDSVISPSDRMLVRLREYGMTRPADARLFSKCDRGQRMLTRFRAAQTTLRSVVGGEGKRESYRACFLGGPL